MKVQKKLRTSVTITKEKDRESNKKMKLMPMKTPKFKVVEEDNIIQGIIKTPTTTTLSNPSSMFKNNHKAIMIHHHKNQQIIHQTFLPRNPKTNINHLILPFLLILNPRPIPQ